MCDDVMSEWLDQEADWQTIVTPNAECYVEEDDQPDYCEDQWKYLVSQCFNDVEGQTDPYYWDKNCDDLVAWMKEA